MLRLLKILKSISWRISLNCLIKILKTRLIILYLTNILLLIKLVKTIKLTIYLNFIDHNILLSLILVILWYCLR